MGEYSGKYNDRGHRSFLLSSYKVKLLEYLPQYRSRNHLQVTGENSSHACFLYIKEGNDY